MSESRIVAYVRSPDLLAGLKAVAATYRARLVHSGEAISREAALHDPTLIALEPASADKALHDFNIAKEACPNAEIIVFIDARAAPEEVRRLFRAGARDVLSLPAAHDQLMSAMGDAIGPGPNGEVRGFVLGIVKAAGGVGATTLAVNIAGHFANPPRGKRGDRMDPLSVALIDLDLQFGDAALAMDISPRKDVTEILRNPKRLDTHFLDSILERHRSGVHLLAAPQTMVPMDALDAETALSIVDVAARSHDLVIVELPTAWSDWTGALLRRADQLLLVSSAAVRGVSGARRILDAAAEMNVEPARWSLAFNRLNSILDGNDIIDQARRALGPTAIGSLMEDPAVRVAGDRGRMIWETAPTTRFAKDIRPLCLEIMQMLEGKQFPRVQRSVTR